MTTDKKVVIQLWGTYDPIAPQEMSVDEFGRAVALNWAQTHDEYYRHGEEHPGGSQCSEPDFPWMKEVRMDADSDGCLWVARGEVYVRLLGLESSFKTRPTQCSPNLIELRCFKRRLFSISWDDGHAFVLKTRTGDSIDNFVTVTAKDGWSISPCGEIIFNFQDCFGFTGRQIAYKKDEDSVWPWPLVYPECFGALNQLKLLLTNTGDNPLTGLTKAADGGHRALAKQVRNELERLRAVWAKEILDGIH